MPADNKVSAPEDAVDKFLSDEKVVEDRRKILIDDLLKKKDAAIKEFDDKLAKLGYAANGKQRRSHHRKGAPAAEPKSPKSPKG
jgi:hypothetical protein